MFSKLSIKRFEISPLEVTKSGFHARYEQCEWDHEIIPPESQRRLIRNGGSFVFGGVVGFLRVQGELVGTEIGTVTQERIIFNRNLWVMRSIVLTVTLLFLSSISFSQTLSELQRNYDQVKKEVAAASVTINYLDADVNRVMFLLSLFEKRRSEIDAELTRTKNYKWAEQDLAKVYQIFADDVEVKAIEKNYSDYKHAESFRESLVKNGTLSLAEFESWQRRILDKYKTMNGANYSNSKKTYNQIENIILGS